jgi:hypothetical protein
LDDIKPFLNPTQQKYFKDLNDLNLKIPRDEVEELGKVVGMVYVLDPNR